MEVYESEDQQVEALKKWWKENGVAVVTGLVLGIGGLVGWQSWQAWQTSRGESASILYEEVLNRVESGDTSGARQVNERLQEEFAGTTYAGLAALRLAPVVAGAGDGAAATELLQGVSAGAGMPELEAIARIHLARLLLDQGRPDDALATLAEMEPGPFLGLVAELRGDALLARGERVAAREAYLQARDNRVSASGHGLLQMKIDDLGSAAGDAS